MTGAEAPALFVDDGRAYDEPWQVELLAVAHALVDAGCFSPAEWAEALGAAIARAQAAGDPDRGDTYPAHCLAALEQLCATKGLLTDVDVDRRTTAWRRAYLRTPHGQAVELPGR